MHLIPTQNIDEEVSEERATIKLSCTTDQNVFGFAKVAHYHPWSVERTHEDLNDWGVEKAVLLDQPRKDGVFVIDPC